MTALDVPYLSDGLAEIEKALDAGEYQLARALAEFLDRQTGALFGRSRVLDALLHGEVAA